MENAHVVISLQYDENQVEITISRQTHASAELAPPPLLILTDLPLISNGKTEQKVASALIEIQKEKGLDISAFSFDKNPAPEGSMWNKVCDTETPIFNYSKMTSLFFKEKQKDVPEDL